MMIFGLFAASSRQQTADKFIEKTALPYIDYESKMPIECLSNRFIKTTFLK